MAINGALKDMSVADLIQSYCQDKKTAHIAIQSNGSQAEIYIQEGQVVHAFSDEYWGDEAVYEALAWEEGEFSLETGVDAPEITIERNWPGLLLEGAKRLDEASLQDGEEPIIESYKEIEPMATKKKGEILADEIKEFLEESADVYGAAIVGFDGLVYTANVPQKGIDETIVGGAAASIFGLSKRGVDQLQKGNYQRTLITGDDGDIIIQPINSETLLIALTPANANLGMAFAEVRSATNKLRAIL